MTQMLALVDYRNLASLSAGRRLSTRDHELALDNLIHELCQFVKIEQMPIDELRVRLYGGWYDEDTRPTQDRDCLRLVVPSPTRRGRLRIFVDVADTLVSLPKDSQIVGTVRLKNGIDPVRVADSSAACPRHYDDCPIFSLNTWLRKGRCPRAEGCTTRITDVVHRLQQKLVDSMLVADTISLAQDSRPDDWIVAVSVDDDIVPGVLAAVRRCPRVGLLRLDRRKPCLYDPLMARAGVHIFDRTTT